MSAPLAVDVTAIAATQSVNKPESTPAATVQPQPETERRRDVGGRLDGVRGSPARSARPVGYNVLPTILNSGIRGSD